MTETKVCIKCGNEFPATDEFFKRHSKTKKLGNICRPCIKQYGKKYYIKNQEKMKQDARDNWNANIDARHEQKKTYYQNNKERIDQYKRQWERDHKEHISAQRKERKEENPEQYRDRVEAYYEKNREVLAARRRKYYEEHRDEILEQKKQYHILNKETILDYKKEYYIKNSDVIRKQKSLFRKSNRKKVQFYYRKRELAKKGLPATLTLEQWGQIKDKFENKCCYCGRELPLEQDHFIPLAKGGEYTVKNIVPACKRCNSSKKTKLLSEWYPKQAFYSKEREIKILEHLDSVM